MVQKTGEEDITQKLVCGKCGEEWNTNRNKEGLCHKCGSSQTRWKKFKRVDGQLVPVEAKPTICF